MTKIKICGLRRPEDIETANHLKPDFCGFITEFPKSRRNVSADQLRILAAKLNPEVVPVGVFVNHAPERIAELLNDGVIRVAQLHGQEDEDYIRRLKAMTEQPIIKAFSIRTRMDAELACASPADYILLDQGDGGTGKTFDWSLVPEIDRPWFLAGGLSAENLAEAIERLHPWAVDLSSAVETDGFKDFHKIRQVIQLTRSGIREKDPLN